MPLCAVDNGAFAFWLVNMIVFARAIIGHAVSYHFIGAGVKGDNTLRISAFQSLCVFFGNAAGKIGAGKAAVYPPSVNGLSQFLLIMFSLCGLQTIKCEIVQIRLPTSRWCDRLNDYISFRFSYLLASPFNPSLQSMSIYCLIFCKKHINSFAKSLVYTEESVLLNLPEYPDSV